MQVIQPTLSIVDVASVPQWVQLPQGCCHAAGNTHYLAPGVVGVFCYGVSAAVQNGNYVTLEVGYVVVCSIVMDYRGGVAVGVVGEAQSAAVGSHFYQLVAVVDVAAGLGDSIANLDSLSCPQTGAVVGEGDVFVGLCDGQFF